MMSTSSIQVKSPVIVYPIENCCTVLSRHYFTYMLCLFVCLFVYLFITCIFALCIRSMSSVYRNTLVLSADSVMNRALEGFLTGDCFLAVPRIVEGASTLGDKCIFNVISYFLINKRVVNVELESWAHILS